MKRILSRLILTCIASAMRLTMPLMHVVRTVYFQALLGADYPGLDPSVQCDGAVHVTGTKNIRIGKRCRFGHDTQLETADGGSILLGNDIRINRGCTLVSYSRISIGDYAIIGEYVSIRDANHGMNPDEPMRYQGHTSSPISIGRDVWIGRGSCILPGVTIGEGAVIGANSVVTTDIPPFTVSAGAPAKVIKARRQ